MFRLSLGVWVQGRSRTDQLAPERKATITENSCSVNDISFGLLLRWAFLGGACAWLPTSSSGLLGRDQRSRVCRCRSPCLALPGGSVFVSPLVQSSMSPDSLAAGVLVMGLELSGEQVDGGGEFRGLDAQLPEGAGALSGTDGTPRCSAATAGGSEPQPAATHHARPSAEDGRRHTARCALQIAAEP